MKHSLVSATVVLLVATFVLTSCGSKKPAPPPAGVSTICSDGEPPVAQRDYGLGQIEYRCHDGSIVKR